MAKRNKHDFEEVGASVVVLPTVATKRAPREPVELVLCVHEPGTSSVDLIAYRVVEER